MKSEDIIIELSKALPGVLVADLVNEFISIRKDLQTQTHSRASSGKFVETVVQLLEHLETGTYSASPSVDAYLKNVESRSTPFNDDLRIVLSRIARSIYTLRNKRNIAHKGAIDPNVYDLRYIYSSAQWVLTEFIRQYVTNDIHKAGEIVEFIQLPVSSIIESIDGRKIVHADLPTKEEVLLVLYSHYPEKINRAAICKSIDRRSSRSVYTAVETSWKEKHIHESDKLYVLTQAGFTKAQDLLKTLS